MKHVVLRMVELGGDAWMPQLVKCLTLDFGSGHDVKVCGFEPHVSFCADSVEPAWNSLSPFLSPAHALFQNK